MPSINTSSVYGKPASSGGIGGLVSGLDTESLVDKLTSGTQSKIDKQYQAQQRLVYRQEAYRTAISKLVKFSDTYFSYTSKTNLLSSNFFRSSTVKSSNDDVKVSGDMNAIKNFSIKNIASVAKNASFTSVQPSSQGYVGTAKIEEKTDVSTISGQSLSIQFGKKTYTLVIDQDFPPTATVQDAADHLNEKIAKIPDLKDKLSYSVAGDKLILNKPAGADVKVIAASDGIINSLNIKLKSDGSSSSAITSLKKESSLKDVLLNGKMVFDFNNKQETISFSKEDFFNTDFFPQSELDHLNTLTGEAKTIKENGMMQEVARMMESDPSKLADVLQKKLDKAYGAGRIDVSSAADGSLKFETTRPTDIFGISAISTDLKKHLGLTSSSYNRLNKSATLEKNNFGISLDSIDDYTLSVNGKEFTFNKKQTINEIVDIINKDADAKVTITHSATTDKFTVVSDETGSHAGVEIKDVSGNLANVMFGKEKDPSDPGSVGYTVSKGEDAVITVSMNGVEETVTRSSNNIFFDGVNIELSNKAAINADLNKDPVSGKQKEVTFTVTDDVDKIVENMKKFVDDYNELVTYFDEQTMESPSKGYEPLTVAQRNEMSEAEIKAWDEKVKQGILFGDNNISSALYDLRESIAGKVDGNSLLMAEIGISSVAYDYTGKLQFEEDTFRQRYAENPDEVANLFTQNIANGKDSEKGIAVRLKEVIEQNVGISGEKGILVDEAGTVGTTKAKDNYLSDRIKDYDDTMTKLKAKLETERTRYWNQFSRLEVTLNNLNSQSSWLASQFS